MPRTAIQAHRGASAYAPENTLPAFELAVAMGADAVELDVHLTRDDRVVVCHDEDLKRVGGKALVIGDSILPQIQAVDVSAGLKGMERFAGVRVPLLADVLDLLKPTNLFVNIELKTDRRAYPGLEEATLALVRAFGMEGRALYSSFNHYTLAGLKALDPSAKTGALYDNGLFMPWDYVKAVGASAVHPYYLNLRIPRFVEHSHANGIAVNVWTLDTEDAIRQALQLGVDGIITDKPDVALALRAEFERKTSPAAPPAPPSES